MNQDEISTKIEECLVGDTEEFNAYLLKRLGKGSFNNITIKWLESHLTEASDIAGEKVSWGSHGDEVMNSLNALECHILERFIEPYCSEDAFIINYKMAKKIYRSVLFDKKQGKTMPEFIFGSPDLLTAFINRMETAGKALEQKKQLQASTKTTQKQNSGRVML